MSIDRPLSSISVSANHSQRSTAALLPAASESLSSLTANTLTTDSFSNPPVSGSTGNSTTGNSTTGNSTTVAAQLQTNSTVPAPSAAAQPEQLHKVGADFNGDGKTDLLWRNYATGQNTIWLMDGTTLISAVSLQSVSDTNWQIEGAADFTGDSKTDILWRNYATGQNVIWQMDGTTFVSALSQLPTVQDLNWHIQGTTDFTNDSKTDILWRNYATGQDLVWVLNGATLNSFVWLPTVAGANLRIQAAADFNQDGNPDILWRNYLSGENFIWSVSGTTIASTTFLPAQTDLNWQIAGAGDASSDGTISVFWRNTTTGEDSVWRLNRLESTIQTAALPQVSDLNWRIGLEDTAVVPGLVKVSSLAFSGQEGDSGTFKIQLTQAPTTNVTLTFSTGDFTVVDADNNVADGTQNSIMFTPQDWNTARTVWFIAEDDNSAKDRLLGNTVSYTLSGGLTGSATCELGKVTNTYAPDPTRFNIDLDFRNDTSGFWTPAKRAIAQKAADDWASHIANEWTDFQLNNSPIGRLDSFSTRTYSFTSKRTVDDLLVFVNPYQSSGGEEPAIAGPDYQFGGWITSPDLMPRVGQIAVNTASFSSQNDPSGWLLYQVVLHELGHVLGLVGLDWIGYNLEDRSTPQTAIFKGQYAKAANGGNYVGLQSQDGANPVTGTYDYSHPANNVQSVMSYGWIYNLYGPSNVDYAMLADSGYRVYGFNA